MDLLSHAKFFMNLCKKIESLGFKNWFIAIFCALGIMQGLLILTSSPKLEKKIKEKQVQHFGRGSTNTHMVLFKI